MKYINCLKTMSELTLNVSNAAFLANLLDSLPSEVKSHIIEFNPEHRKAMSKVFDLLVRFVYCPSYFSSLDEEITDLRIFQNAVVGELKQINICHMCENYKESDVILKQMKIGFWHNDGSVNHSNDLKFCSDCYNDVMNWDRLKYVKHYVINDHTYVAPFSYWHYLSPLDNMETIIKAFEISEDKLVKMMKSSIYWIHQYDHLFDELECEKEHLIEEFEKRQEESRRHDSDDDDYYYDLDGYYSL